jgi:hypothetical protein
MKWSKNLACMGKKLHAYRVWGEKPQGNGPLGTSRNKWEDNIQMCLREIKWGAPDWIHLAWDKTNGGLS